MWWPAVIQYFERLIKMFNAFTLPSTLELKQFVYLPHVDTSMGNNVRVLLVDYRLVFNALVGPFGICRKSHNVLSAASRVFVEAPVMSVWAQYLDFFLLSTRTA